MKIIDTLSVSFDFLDFKESLLAKVTLNFNDEIEVRFCPIFWTKDRSTLFFTMPSLRNYKWHKCVIILDPDDYKKVESKVMTEFMAKAKLHYLPNQVKLMKKAINSGKTGVMNPNADLK